MGLRVISLASGSSGNCILVEADESRLLVDAGPSAKYIAGELETVGVPPTSLNAILLTHEHSDHVGSARTLARRHQVPIIGNEATLAAANIDPGQSALMRTGEATSVGALRVSSFALPHDGREPVGYFIEYHDWRVCVATDLGRAPESLLDYVRAADLVVLEANHDRRWLAEGPYPAALKARVMSDRGHLSNDDAAEVLVRATSGCPQQVWLAHLSDTNNSPRRALTSVRSRLDREGITTVQVSVALRDRRSLVWRSEESWIQLPMDGSPD